jgi:hypothetical protein
LTLTGVLSQSFSSISPVSSRCFSSMTFRLSDFVPLNDYGLSVENLATNCGKPINSVEKSNISHPFLFLN